MSDTPVAPVPKLALTLGGLHRLIKLAIPFTANARGGVAPLEQLVLIPAGQHVHVVATDQYNAITAAALAQDMAEEPGVIFLHRDAAKQLVRTLQTSREHPGGTLVWLTQDMPGTITAVDGHGRSFGSVWEASEAYPLAGLSRLIAGWAQQAQSAVNTKIQLFSTALLRRLPEEVAMVSLLDEPSGRTYMRLTAPDWMAIAASYNLAGLDDPGAYTGEGTETPATPIMALTQAMVAELRRTRPDLWFGLGSPRRLPTGGPVSAELS